MSGPRSYRVLTPGIIRRRPNVQVRPLRPSNPTNEQNNSENCSPNHNNNNHNNKNILQCCASPHIGQIDNFCCQCHKPSATVMCLTCSTSDVHNMTILSSVQRKLRSLVNSANDNVQGLEKQARALESDQKSLAIKIKKKSADLERSEKRLKSQFVLIHSRQQHRHHSHPVGMELTFGEWNYQCIAIILSIISNLFLFWLKGFLFFSCFLDLSRS